MERFTKEGLEGKSQSEIFDLFYSEGAYNSMYEPKGMAEHLIETAKYIIGLIPAKAARILEVGSGVGQIVRFLYKHGYKNIIGTDISSVAIGRAEYKELMVVCEAKDLPFEDGAFDILVSVGTYEHIPVKDIDASFRELIRVAKKAILFIDQGGTDPTHYTNEAEWYWVDRIKRVTGAEVRIDERFTGGSNTHPILINL